MKKNDILYIDAYYSFFVQKFCYIINLWREKKYNENMKKFKEEEREESK